jgi:dTDP-4-amino-4,6-dideoxygalactose transaminase
VPDFTFAATGHAVLKAGKSLHLLDVNEFDWALDHNLVYEYTKKVSCGIIPVTPFGSNLNFFPWQAYEEVVFDAAASFGAPKPDFSEMKPNWFVVYSLHATKILPSGEGAVVVCGSSEKAQELRQWANFGFSGSRISVSTGTNAKMSEIAAAYGLTSLVLKDRELDQWHNALNLAKNASANEYFDTKLSQIEGARPYWIAKFESERSRSEMVELLDRHYIQSRFWWAAPLSSMKPFESAISVGSNPVSRHLANTVLGLPMFRGITFSEVDSVLRVLQKGK